MINFVEKPHVHVTPVGRVRYVEDAFDPPAAEVVSEVAVDRLKPEFVARFHAIVEELTDELMSAGTFDRAGCRADAITLLTAASDRLQKDDAFESPLSYLLMEERQKAAASLGAHASNFPKSTFLKA